jgi:hypothetical protein
MWCGAVLMKHDSVQKLLLVAFHPESSLIEHDIIGVPVGET